MTKAFDPSTLPEDVARAAAAQVAAGRFASIEDVVRAGVEAVAREGSKLEALRAALIEGEQSGEAPPGTFDRMRAAIRHAAHTP